MAAPAQTRELVDAVEKVLTTKIDSLKSTMEARLEGMRDEFNVTADGIGDRVSFLRQLFFWILSVLGVIVAGGIALHIQLGDVRSEISGLKATISAFEARFSRMERSLEEVRSSQTQMTAALARIEGTLQPPKVPQPAPFVSSDEAQTIRSWLKIPDPKGVPSFKLGQIILDENSKLFPAELIAKIPQLKGYRYSVDRANFIAVIEGRSGQIIQII